MQREQRDGDQDERNRIGRGGLGAHRELEELPEPQRHDLEPRRQRDDRRRAEQRDRIEEHDDAPPMIAGVTSGSVTRQIVRRLPAPRMFAASSISEETQLERIGGEHEDVGKGVERGDEHQAAEAVDVGEAGLAAGQRHPDAVEPARIRPGEQDPADRAEIGRRDEGAEDHRAHEILARHVGARDATRRSAPRTRRRARVVASA